MITIVDYGMGNLRSVNNALDLLGADVEITSEPEKILAAERLILPGVGAFGLAMQHLRERGLVEALNQKVLNERTPILAICLGMQLLGQSSNEHGQHNGLGWLPGRVQLFELTDLRVPHVGWNNITLHGKPPLFNTLADQSEMYFVHSYHYMLDPDDDQSVIAATTDYGYEFVAAVHRDNIFGTQFHPEKSQAAGLKILQNFMMWEVPQKEMA